MTRIRASQRAFVVNVDGLFAGYVNAIHSYRAALLAEVGLQAAFETVFPAYGMIGIRPVIIRWEHATDGALTFLETKNGKPWRIPLSPAIEAVPGALPRQHAHVFTNAVTMDRYTTNGARHVFTRAVERAGIRTGDVTLHTLRHTALNRMIEKGYDDYTVMALSGHSSTRMLARYTHPSEERKAEALGSFSLPRVTMRHKR